MLYKNPKPQYRKIISNTAKILFVTEAFLFAGSYAIWYRLNNYRGKKNEKKTMETNGF
jgi:hypothetical protein